MTRLALARLGGPGFFAFSAYLIYLPGHSIGKRNRRPANQARQLTTDSAEVPGSRGASLFLIMYGYPPNLIALVWIAAELG
jgi:hypothetical protein